ncbi:relaxin receptor 1 isoform X3 [Procambarus clarkii]|uniref:relaxin receptor 1 isoform X3 n=1 Tax=Procambarus clarkii TaxID=6728 RepID=UPI00374307B5
MMALTPPSALADVWVTSMRAWPGRPLLLLSTHLLLLLLPSRVFTSPAVLHPLLWDGTCEVGWFECGHNSTLCVEQRFFCNGVRDCPGGHDELNCVPSSGDSSAAKAILNKKKLLHEEIHSCSLTRVPAFCMCRIETLLHCKAANLTSVPQDLDTNVTGLLLGNNSIVLTPDSFTRYPSLTLLHLENNGLRSIPRGVFKPLTNLAKLFLAKNHLGRSDGLRPSLEELGALPSLHHLDLSYDSLTQFDLLLDLAPGLKALFLNFNRVTLRGREVSPNAHSLKDLFLEHNLVEELTKDSLRGFTGLEALYLRHNKIRVIHPGAFLELHSLLDLELHNNRIQSIHPETFEGLTALVNLGLKGNPLVVVASDTFRTLPKLDSLGLADMELSVEQLLNVSRDLAHNAVTHAHFKRFRYCGYFPRVPNCSPKTDGVSSFEHLLVRLELRVTVWLVAAATLVGNLTVLGGRGLSRDDNKVLSLFIRNLAVADLLTGFYLVVVAVKDLQFRSEYHVHAYYWMTSWECTITGVLAMTSAEVSVLILAFMSVERWVCITWPLAAPKLSHEGAKLALACIWALGIVISIIPVMYYRGQQGFYGTNGLCFPLHLDDPWVPGWLYSALVFVGLNQIGVVLILMSYTGMFYSIRRTRANTPLSLGDREFAMRFFFIVFTDCLCWTPIIILRIMALADIDITPKLYAYVVVVLLPINSALNPFLYTFTTTKFRSQVRRFFTGHGMCRWPPRRDSDSEVTRTSFFRSATCRLTNGRDILHLHNGASHAVDDTTVAEVSRISLIKDENTMAETKL